MKGQPCGGYSTGWHSLAGVKLGSIPPDHQKEKTMAQVTCWDKAEVECRAAIKRLAEMPCLDCDGAGGWMNTRPEDVPDTTICKACDGTGARFPWARDYSHQVTCPDSHGHCMKSVTTDCGGKGWVPNYKVRLEDVVSHMTSVHLDLRWDNKWLAQVGPIPGQPWEEAIADTLLLAFFVALVKAVSK